MTHNDWTMPHTHSSIEDLFLDMRMLREKITFNFFSCLSEHEKKLLLQKINLAIYTVKAYIFERVHSSNKSKISSQTILDTFDALAHIIPSESTAKENRKLLEELQGFEASIARLIENPQTLMDAKHLALTPSEIIDATFQ